MAATSDEITLETKRCIFVDDYIYFSNYYLKSKITEANVTLNNVKKIKFDDKEFMNKTMIDLPKQKLKSTLEITSSPLPDLTVLNESLYSKVSIANISIAINIAESDILELKIELKKIFKDNEQIKQFLKYDGWWCPEAQRIEFDDKDGTKEAKLVDTIILPVEVRIATSSNARSQEEAQVKQLVANALKGANNVNNVTSDDDQQQTQGSSQGSGGNKKTRSTRNHKNRKSKKN
jgi:hypothetical protein